MDFPEGKDNKNEDKVTATASSPNPGAEPVYPGLGRGSRPPMWGMGSAARAGANEDIDGVAKKLEDLQPYGEASKVSGGSETIGAEDFPSLSGGDKEDFPSLSGNVKIVPAATPKKWGVSAPLPVPVISASGSTADKPAPVLPVQPSPTAAPAPSFQGHTPGYCVRAQAPPAKTYGVHPPQVTGGMGGFRRSTPGSSGGAGFKGRGPSDRSGKGAGGQTGKGRKLRGSFISDETEFCDIVQSRQLRDDGAPKTKQGTQGKKVEFSTNYYPLVKLTNFNLFHYHLEYKPNEERTAIRKKLVQIHESTLGAFIFDGQALYTPHRIITKALYSLNPTTQTKTQISLKLVAEINPLDPIFLQVYNIMFRSIMTHLSLELMGRFYYDPLSKTTIPSRKLEVWPGYITSVRNHENQILLNLEVTHKVVRSDSVLDFIENTRSVVRGDFRKELNKVLLGSIVVTSYNKKNYKVDEIKWEVTPKDTFKMRDGTNMSYQEYYRNQYGSAIRDLTQPMLVSLPKKKDFHRGSVQPIYLVPELCQMTGLTDAMRKDVKLMKDMAGHLSMPPAERVRKANAFIERWYADPKIVTMLQGWNVEVGRRGMKCLGRVVDLDDLVVGQPAGMPVLRRPNGDPEPAKVKQDKPGDWSNIFKNKPMLTTVPLRKWVLITPPQNEDVIKQMLISLKTSAKSMAFSIGEPLTTLKMKDLRPNSYSSAIQNLYTQLKEQVQMFVVVLPNNNAEVYSAIKRKCYCEIGVSCQCLIVKTLMNKNISTIASRLAIQMNAKLGGEPWSVEIPLRDIMVVGYDVFHSPNRRVASVGALVATTSPTLGRYYTCPYFHKNRSELSANLCSQMSNALYAYKTQNNRLPARIILYRDGVGDGQLSYIYNTELTQIREAIHRVYSNFARPPPKFSFIVVTKRIHTRIFSPGSIPSIEQNPPPGTIVDDVITLPERYDFFFVSQNVTGVGTVSPTSFNVLFDEQGLEPDRMQRFTLKLCHLYYNYTGTIAVPAPCQFAHKLAYLTGMNLAKEVNPKLQNFLYFL